MIVIGGGVIGLELGQVYKRLGAEVTVVEFMDRIIPGMDGALSKELMKVMKKQKVNFNLSHKVKSVERKGDEVIVKADNKKGEAENNRDPVRNLHCQNIGECRYCQAKREYNEDCGLNHRKAPRFAVHRYDRNARGISRSAATPRERPSSAF
jgi:heterodisulfide reductase subunit A-like polyferredoxin